MEEDINNNKEVIVQSGQNKTRPLNDAALVSGRMFSVEETRRFAAGLNDPSRIATSFPGVSNTGDINALSIRGNAPNGLLWRMEGVEISNPNHFARVGTSGGGISILSAQLLANSDFLTGAFPAEYGNATAGVFDLGFRSGNNKKRETTLQMGVITGLEATTEGPFSKKSDASYVVGYRYSLAGVAQKMGVDIGTTALPSYQDLSFKVAMLNLVSEATSFSNSIALSEVESIENSYKLETILLFISSTALLVKVIAKIFR